MFIDRERIDTLLAEAAGADTGRKTAAVEKAERGERLDYADIATLLYVNEPELMARIYAVAGEIKRKIYGNRIVLFAPLYVSNYCVNNCVYCGFQHCNAMPRKKLNRAEIQAEVRALERMGHKRLALEADPRSQLAFWGGQLQMHRGILAVWKRWVDDGIERFADGRTRDMGPGSS